MTWLAYRAPAGRRQYLVHGRHDGHPVRTWGRRELAARFPDRRAALIALIGEDGVVGALRDAPEAVEPLPPLDPAVDYSRSGHDAVLRERGWKVSPRRTPDVAYEHAPAGYCRACGQDIGARLADGRVDVRRRWHPDCRSSVVPGRDAALAAPTDGDRVDTTV